MLIRGIVAEPELGVIYTGKVVKVVDFGAFVNFLDFDDRGKVKLSMKCVDQETGEDITAQIEAEKAERRKERKNDE